MCFVHGLSDGRYLLDEEFLKPEDARAATCTCSQEHSNHGSTRRQALSRGAMGAGAAVLGSTILGKAVLPSTAGATGPTSGDRVVMIGVNGGPLLSPAHKQPTLALHVDGANAATYLIDCGYDTANQMVLAGLPFSQLKHVFITHGHSDHISGYAPLALHSFIGNVGTGGIRSLDFWGPKPMVQMQRDLLRSYKVDINSRKVSGGADMATLLDSHQYTLPKRGVRKVMEDSNVIVHATRVKHGADIADAYGYRFTIKSTGRAITFSGDTAPNPNLIDLAQGSHTLVHEAMDLGGVEALLAGVDPSQRDALREHILTTHTDVKLLPGIAKAAGVQRLVLCHYTPAFIPMAKFLNDAKTAAASVGFAGEILAPTDLDSFAL